MSWLLLLAQMPVVLLSGTPPRRDEEDDFKGPLTRVKRRLVESEFPIPKAKKTSRSIDAQSEDRDESTHDNIEELQTLEELDVPDVPFEKKSFASPLQALESVARDLDLLLPGEEGRVESIHELPWNPAKIVPVRDKESTQFARIRNSYRSELIGPSKIGQMIVLPFRRSDLGCRDSWLLIRMNQRRYILVGGSVTRRDSRNNAVTHHSFKVDKDGISWEPFDKLPFSLVRQECHFKKSYIYEGTYELPLRIPHNDNSSSSLSYDYGIYCDDGPWDSPYNIPYFRLTRIGISQDEMIAKAQRAGIVNPHLETQGTSLVRFIQLRTAGDPRHEFANETLREIQADLRTLRDNDVEKLNDISTKACRFIYDNTFYHGGNDYELFIRFSFLSILKIQESTMNDCIFMDSVSAPLSSETDIMKYRETICDALPESLVFHTLQVSWGQSPLIFHTVTCPNRSGGEVHLQMVGMIDTIGDMMALGTGTSSFQDMELLKITWYAKNCSVTTINSPLLDQSRPPTTFTGQDAVYIYRIAREGRYLKTKSARF